MGCWHYNNMLKKWMRDDDYKTILDATHFKCRLYDTEWKYVPQRQHSIEPFFVVRIVQWIFDFCKEKICLKWVALNQKLEKRAKS